MPDPTAPRPSIDTAADRRRRAIAITAFFATLTVVFTYPLPVQLGTHLMGTGSDPELYMWTLGWNAHAFLHQPTAIFDANIFHPAKYALAYSENLIGSAILVAPWLWITGDLVTAVNVVELSSVFLSAIGAYLLARRLGLGVAAAILAGIIFGFTPARLFRMPQVHITTIQWLPFCLAFLHTYFAPGGRPRDLKLAALFFTAQALTSGHGAVFLAVAAVAYVIYQTACGAPLAIVARARDLGVSGLLLLMPAALLLVPYQRAKQEVPNLERTLDDFGVSLSSYVSSPSHVHEWLWRQLPDWLTATPPDASLFPGVLPIALALVAAVTMNARRRAGHSVPALESDVEPQPTVRARWRANPVPFYVLLALLSIWFTLGPPLGLWSWTYSWPVFSFMRVPSRFVLLEILCLAVLSGFGFERLTRGAGRRRVLAAAVFTGALLLAEFAPMPLSTVAYSVAPPAADRWLATRPKPFVVAEVPVPDSLSHDTRARWNTRYMLHASAHWQKIVHGYSGVEPDFSLTLHWQLTRFPDPESLRAATDAGVTYIVMHPQLYAESERGDAEARFARYKDWLTLEYSSADGRVYRLRKPAGP